MIKLFESFKEIEDICLKYRIKNYAINSDGSIDVNEDVYLSYKKLDILPLKFNRITGDFLCDNNKLTALEGCPKEVGGDFYCEYNQLTSLKRMPQKIGGDLYCAHNKIWTFDGMSDYINGEFYCVKNTIYHIWDLFQDYSKIELFNYYDIIREVDGKPAIILDRLNDFLEEIGKKPVKVKGYLNI